MKSTVIAILIAGVLIGGTIMFSGRSFGDANSTAQAQNVSIVGGKQFITITAKGGYAPRVSMAHAGMPTTIRVETRGTFDCSSALTIPAIGYRTNLSPSGTTDIEIPPQKAGTSLEGLCTMGMYNFTVNFN